MLVGEYVGPEELREGKPFSGSSGHELRKMLNEAGLAFFDCYVTNVLRFMPSDLDQIVIRTAKKGIASGFPQFNGRWCHPQVIEHVDLLKREIALVQPNVVVACGNLALWALLGEDGITNWRGYVEPATLLARPDGTPYKVVPTFNPAGVQRNWPWRWDSVQDFRRAKAESGSPTLHEPAYRFLIRPSFMDARDWLLDLLAKLDQAREPMWVNSDIETRRKHIACIGIATSKLEAACFPLMCVERREGYWSFEEELVITQLLSAVLTHPKTWLMNQHITYDCQYWARRMGIMPKVGFDTAIGHHVCFADQITKLNYLVPRYCEHPRYWKDESREWEVKAHSEDHYWGYNCKDNVYTYEITEVLNAPGGVIDRMGLRKQLNEQMELFPAVLKMMLRGVRRDEASREVVGAELEAAIKRIQSDMAYVLGHPINPRAHIQMHKLFYHDLAQQPVLDRKTRRPTLDDDALEVIERREPLLKPLIDNIRDVRSLGVFKSTFVDAVAEDGRIRCSYKQAGPKTYRWASSEDAFGCGGNLQNIPKPDEEEQDRLPPLRKLFLSDEGYTIHEWDLDRAELYVLVWECEDTEYKQMLADPSVDPHAINAKIIGMTRQQAKTWVYATNYGASPRTTAIKCGVTVHASERGQARWFAAHPGIKRWHQETEAQLRASNTVSNKFGYRIFYFDRVDGLLPKALSWKCQSTIGIVINKVLVNIDRNLPEVEVLLQVHDSLVVQTRTETTERLVPQIQEQFRVIVPYSDPLVIPVSGKWSRENWGACKPIPKELLQPVVI